MCVFLFCIRFFVDKKSGSGDNAINGMKPGNKKGFENESRQNEIEVGIGN